jgi:cytochrome d ubiquinol oxidase subunit I
MEGMFAFFLESSFLALLVFGERRLSRRGHFLAAIALWVGSWLSGYFIVATNAFMQHPVGYVVDAAGKLQLADFWAFVMNPWALAQYPHTILGAVVTGAFVVAGIGAWWTLRGEHADAARTNLAFGTAIGLVASLLVAFPTGDHQGKLVAKHQPIALAAMEGRFESGTHAEIVLIGQPSVAERKLDNPIAVPGILSFVAYGSFSENVRGLNEFPENEWPTQIELLYYSFHIMAGLGTFFILLMAVASLARWRGVLYASRTLSWALLLAVPFPFIANTVGWMTAELGRQPWVVYGLMRTSDASSPNVHGGSTLFTLIGFMGLYLVIGCLYLFLVGREIAHGPPSRPLDEARRSTP